jgi:hypothetical protein
MGTPLTRMRFAAAMAGSLVLGLGGCGGSPSAKAPAPPSAAAVRPDHIVVVIEENHSARDIVGDTDAPYINSLVHDGAQMTRSFATTHPSQPNYLDLFSGSTQGVTDDACPPARTPFRTPNLASSLAAAGRSFAGYSEDLPAPGSDACIAGGYARKHNPWSDFTNVAPAANRPFTDFPHGKYSGLPTVSFVVPNLRNDMHDGTVAEADAWLRTNIDGYRRWAESHNSLLVVTWDEDDYGAANQILTVLVGPMVRPGAYDQHVTHDDLLRTLGDLTGAQPTGRSAEAHAIAGIWLPA